jgi:archaetidylinositol phosphate synthase
MSQGTWLHRIARLAARPLASTPVTPNQVTTARLLSGLAAAVLFAAGNPGADLAAAALFLFSMLCDRADGELARLTGRTSAWGHRYDLVTDAVCNTLVLVAIGYGARAGVLGDWGPVLGLIAGAAVAATFGLLALMEARHGPDIAEVGGMAGFDPDDALIAVPLLMAFGWREELVIAAAVAAPVAAVAVGLLLRGRALAAARDRLSGT